VNGYHPYIGYQGSDQATLADWRTATGQDAASQDVDPSFVSVSDLHTAVPPLNNAGIYIPTVTTDYAGMVRTNPPDVGAYEFTLPIASVNTLGASSIGQSSAVIDGDISTSGEVVAVSFEYGTDLSYGNTVNALPTPVRSLTASEFSATISGLGQNTLYHYRANGISATSGEIVHGNDMTFTSLGVPVSTTVGNDTVHNGQDTCFNASQTITIAGSGTTFVVENGGNAMMIAGQNILYLPGTKVDSGGYMHGSITFTNEYCNTMPLPVVAVKASIEDHPAAMVKTMFSVYPNPTNGSFTIELSGKTGQGEVNLEIYGIRGDKVLKTNFTGLNKQTISLEGQPTGIYFLRIISDGQSGIRKIIKQ
jgi:hypothetical protein